MHRFEPLVAKDYCRYKPVSIQAYGAKCEYSEVTLEPIGNIDPSAEETNGTEIKSLDAKKENETFGNKISNWLNMSSNNDSKSSSSQFDNSMNASSKNTTPVEGIIIFKFL